MDGSGYSKFYDTYVPGVIELLGSLDRARSLDHAGARLRRARIMASKSAGEED